MQPSLDAVLSTIDQQQDQSLDQLKALLSIPSVSAKSEHRPDMRRAAQWLHDQLAFAELDVSVMETGKDGSGHPAVVAKNRHEPGRPTVLFYGHYDVQPPEPVGLWQSPAFEPSVRGGSLYARGASDDKGQVWCHVAAIQAWQAHGGVPVNLTVLIEGEEEVASANLESFLKHYADDLRADVALISDTGMLGPDRPAITYGLRGLLYCEVELTAANTEEQVTAMQEVLQTSADEFYVLGISRPGELYYPFNTRMGNIPETWVNGWLQGSHKILYPEQWVILENQ